MSKSLSTIAPQVNTLAKPIPGLLMAARKVAQKEPTAKSCFCQAKAEGWPVETLVDRLAGLLQDHLQGVSPQEVSVVAQYLVDEYTQLGDSLLLISPDTGVAIAKIREEDLWQPPPVERGGGGMVTPSPRIRPDLEAFLVDWTFNEARDKELQTDLAKRLENKALAVPDAERKLLPVTRGGRKKLLELLKENLPTAFEVVQGSARTFLDHFDFTTDLQKSLVPLVRAVGVSRSLIPITDAHTFNLSYDHLSGLTARIGTHWAQDIALTLGLASHTKEESKTSLDVSGAPREGLWLLDPDLANTGLEAFLVPGVQPTYLKGKVGEVQIDPESFVCMGREFQSRWDVLATFEYTLWVDWAKVTSYVLTGLPHVSLQAEVLSKTGVA